MSLVQTLNNIGYTLSLPSSAWSEKLDAIHKLDNILRTEGHRMKGSEIDMNIKMGLCAATNDNRSQLVTESCNTIALMCEVLQQRIEAVAGDIFLTIFEKASSGNSVISQAISNCCLNMVNVVCMDRVVSHLERFLNSRSDKVQISTANCILVMVSSWPESCIRKHSSTFIRLIELGVKAPRSNVRQVMRDVSERYYAKYPLQAETRTPSTVRHAYLNSPSPASRHPTPSKETAIKPSRSGYSFTSAAAPSPSPSAGASAGMKGFVPQQRMYSTPRSVEAAIQKTGVEPRNLAGNMQVTPTTPRQAASRLPQAKLTASRLNSYAVTSTASTPSATAAAAATGSASSRVAFSPAQPRRQTSYTATQNSAAKPSGGYASSRPHMGSERGPERVPERVPVGSPYRGARVTSIRNTETVAMASSSSSLQASQSYPSNLSTSMQAQAAGRHAGGGPSSRLTSSMTAALPSSGMSTGYTAPVERRMEVNEIVQKLSAAMMEESELLKTRASTVKVLLGVENEEEKRKMVESVLSYSEETIMKIQSVINEIKPFL